MVSHPPNYLEQLKKTLHLVPHYSRLEDPQSLLCLLARVFSSKHLGVTVIWKENQMPAPVSITHHHPLCSLQVAVQTITQVQVAKALIMEHKYVKDIE